MFDNSHTCKHKNIYETRDKLWNPNFRIIYLAIRSNDTIHTKPAKTTDPHTNNSQKTIPPNHAQIIKKSYNRWHLSSKQKYPEGEIERQQGNSKWVGGKKLTCYPETQFKSKGEEARERKKKRSRIYLVVGMEGRERDLKSEKNSEGMRGMKTREKFI